MRAERWVDENEKYMRRRRCTSYMRRRRSTCPGRMWPAWPWIENIADASIGIPKQTSAGPRGDLHERDRRDCVPGVPFPAVSFSNQWGSFFVSCWADFSMISAEGDLDCAAFECGKEMRSHLNISNRIKEIFKKKKATEYFEGHQKNQANAHSDVDFIIQIPSDILREKIILSRYRSSRVEFQTRFKKKFGRFA